jgi:hypothetical protein
MTILTKEEIEDIRNLHSLWVTEKELAKTFAQELRIILYHLWQEKGIELPKPYIKDEATRLIKIAELRAMSRAVWGQGRDKLETAYYDYLRGEITHSRYLSFFETSEY